jgi:hypothetical protein
MHIYHRSVPQNSADDNGSSRFFAEKEAVFLPLLLLIISSKNTKKIDRPLK